MDTPDTQTPDVQTAPVAPQEVAVDATQFDGLTVSVRRNEARGAWEAYVTLGGAEWVLAATKLGGLDDDLQEAATPSFKEKRRLYYEREVLGLR